MNKKEKEDIRETIQSIYTTYGSLIHSRCKRIVKSDDDAWDVTQEVFMKLMTSYNTINNKQALLAWLLRTSTNKAISLLRKKRTLTYDDTLPESIDPHENNETKTLNRAILTKLLKPWDKKTIALVIYSYIDGYNQEEISNITGMGKSTIRKYLSRFKTKSQKWKNDHHEFKY